MRTLDEYRNSAAERVSRLRGGDQLPGLQVLAQEAVRIDALTHDPAWDHFLRYLEAAIVSSEARREHEFGKLRDPLVVNGDEIAKLKARITALDARVAALKEVLLLPRFLREQSELAQRQIAAMTAENAPIHPPKGLDKPQSPCHDVSAR